MISLLHPWALEMKENKTNPLFKKATMTQVLSVKLCQFLPGSFSSFFFQVKKNKGILYVMFVSLKVIKLTQ